MKVAYLAASPVPSSVASSVHVVKMCQGMAHLGHEVRLLSPDRAEVRREVTDVHEFYGVDRSFTIERLEWPPAVGWFYYPCAVAMALRALRARPDLAYGRFPEAALAAAELGLPVIFETHLPLHHTGPIGALHRRLLGHRRLLRIVVISRALKEELVRRFPLRENLVTVIPDAADDPGTARAERLGPADRLQVGYVGNVYPGKGVETVLELAAICPWADFHVIGGEPPQLQDLTKIAGALPNLHLHGYIPHGRTDRLRGGCDVLLAPYHRRVGTHGGGEAARWMSPLKLFEYMAAGRAILMSDLPVLREVVDDGVHAVLCEPEDARAWAAALAKLADDPPGRERLGRAARARFLERHTWRARAEAALRDVRPGRVA